MATASLRGVPNSLQEHYDKMQELLGPPTHEAGETVRYPVSHAPKQVLLGLWDMWNGVVPRLSMFFVDSLAEGSPDLRALFPVEDYDTAIPKYGLSAKGALITFDRWEFPVDLAGHVGARHAPDNMGDRREFSVQTFSNIGRSFRLPLTWMKTHKAYFSSKIKQMQSVIRATWLASTLRTIKREAVKALAKRMSRASMTHSEFMKRFDIFTQRMLSLGKDGISFNGMEADIVAQGRTDGFEFDTVLVPPTVPALMNVVRANVEPYRYFNRNRAPLIATKDQLGQTLKQKQIYNMATTNYFGLKILESQYWSRGEGQPSFEPLSGMAFISERYLALPPRGMSHFKNYRSFMRNIEIINGDVRRWELIRLKDMLDNSGIFSLERETGRRVVTEHGINILKTLCGMAGHEQADPKQTPAEGSESRAMFPTLDLEQPAHQPGRVPFDCNAHTLFRQSGIIEDVIDMLCDMPHADFDAFVDAVSRDRDSPKDLIPSADFDVHSRSYDERLAGTDRRFARATVPSGFGRRAFGSGRAGRAAPLAERKHDGGGSLLQPQVRALARQVLEAQDKAFIQRRGKGYLVNDDSGVPLVLPHAAERGDGGGGDGGDGDGGDPLARSLAGKAIIPYSGHEKPTTMALIEKDPYWEKLSTYEARHRTLDRLPDRAATIARLAQTGTVREDADVPWAILWLLGRGSNHTWFDLTTPALEHSDTKTKLQLVAQEGLNISGTRTADAKLVRAFVQHIVDGCNPNEAINPFIHTLNVAYEVPDNMVEIICNFMKEGRALSALTSHEQTILAGIVPEEKVSVKRARIAEQTCESVTGLLRGTPLEYRFFDACIRYNVPFPMSFILFRMHIKIKTSAVVFLKSGPDTGVVVIENGTLSFTPDHATMTLQVTSRFSAATIILEPRALRIVPHALATGYENGAGCRMYSQDDVMFVRNKRYNKDIFVFAVPYQWQDQLPFTDITGIMHPRIYNGKGHGTELSTTQFITAAAYRALWRMAQTAWHMWTIEALSGDGPQNPTLATQGVQRIHTGDNTSPELTGVIMGQSPLGCFAEPRDFAKINSMAATAYNGNGMESGTTRRHLGAERGNKGLRLV